MEKATVELSEIFDVFSKEWYQTNLNSKLETINNMSTWRNANSAYTSFKNSKEENFDLGSGIMALSLILQQLLTGYHPDFKNPASQEEMEQYFKNIADDAGEISKGQKKEWDNFLNKHRFSSNEIFNSSSKEGLMTHQDGSRYKTFILALETGFTIPEMVIFHFMEYAEDRSKLHILEVIPQNILELIYHYINEKKSSF